MKSVSELERELKEAKLRERLLKERCISCSGKGWYVDSTYDRCGVDVDCETCHGSGLPKYKVDEIIDAAFLPFRKIK